MRTVVTVSNRGLISLPAKMRKSMGLKSDDQLIAETTPDGILLRPCVTVAIEIYSHERIQEFDAEEADLGTVLKRLGQS